MLPVVTTALWFLSFMKPHANKKRGAFLEACSTFLIRVLPQVAVDCAGAVEGVMRVDMIAGGCFGARSRAGDYSIEKR